MSPVSFGLWIAETDLGGEVRPWQQFAAKIV
jgi:hypothetical protein